ncbi:tRNA-modifying protein YgfZ [Paraglaciecola aquimarina]|uniref:tRNA-modifying protein YgfZ n=1 Tax=Paraglaciecola algarum TaxID=3050085 RepID=A0ABS9D1D2_9ALTE|nr:tRNA-modifying protein YgfZ [Paraglaciecola sp. G1-23]MCF2946540.1 tRNA-modifying protein YgfZ [Paraglaciecola sp. G1-23]
MSSATKEYITPITNKGVIQLTGEERVKYLQGQVTSDVAKLDEQKLQLTCHCDFKGKTWSVSYALNWQDSILLLPHKTALAKSLAELNKYGVFAKVEIADQTDNWQIIGGVGETFEQAIQDLFGSVPNTNEKVISNENGLAVLVSSLHLPSRFMVLQPIDAKQKLASESTDKGHLWEMDEIKAGIGEISEPTANEFVPQMLNLHCVDAIDFEKGCYMGQEVIARTKYLGRNKKAGFILASNSTQSNLTGESLEFEIEGNWRPGGTILRSATNDEQTWIFAVLAKDTQLGTEFRLKSKPDVIFNTQALPYELT